MPASYSFRKHLNIRKRIIILFFIPLITLLLLSFFAIQNPLSELKQLKKLERIIDFAQETSELFNSLQDERDLSYGLTGNGKIEPSVELFFEKKLAKQRQISDRALEKYKTYLDANHDDIVESLKLKKVTRKSIAELDKLPEGRALVDKHQLKYPGGYTMGYYATPLKNLSESIMFTKSFFSTNENISNLIMTFHHIIQLKSHTGIERGIMIREINGEHNIIRYGRIRVLHFGINDHLSKIRLFAPPKIIAQLNEIQQDPSAIQLRNIRKTFSKSPLSRATLGLKEWFNLSSNFIDAIRIVENRSLTLLQTAAKLQTNKSKYKLEQISALLFIIIFLLMVGSAFLMKSILRPLFRLTRFFKHLEKTRELNHKLPETGSDELSRVYATINKLLGKIRYALYGIDEQAEKLDNVAIQVASATEETLRRTENQNIATDNVSVAIEQMSTTIQEVSKTTKETANIVSGALDLANESSEEANSSRKIVAQLVTELGDNAASIETLKAEINDISTILNVITSVAEQTNLLALNAAIEAARAGSAGRGFAVVAEEVRALATRTQESTEQIRRQIESLQNRAIKSNQKMIALQRQGEKAVDTVMNNMNAFKALHDELHKITNISVYIATASEQQATVSNDINKKIHLIRSDSEEMADHAKETAKSGRALIDSSESLKRYMQEFKSKSNSDKIPHLKNDDS